MSPATDRPVIRVTEFRTLARLAERYQLLVLYWSAADSVTFVMPDEAVTYWHCTDPAAALQPSATPLPAAKPQLGLRVTAQGIATAEQIRVLARLGVQAGQGPYLGRPKPATGIVGLLQSRRRVRHHPRQQPHHTAPTRRLTPTQHTATGPDVDSPATHGESSRLNDRGGSPSFRPLRYSVPSGSTPPGGVGSPMVLGLIRPMTPVRRRAP
jgi:hypothetical protein